MSSSTSWQSTHWRYIVFTLFVMDPIRGLVSRVSQNDLVLSSGSLVLVILLSYALAMVMRVYLKEEVIMSESHTRKSQKYCHIPENHTTTSKPTSAISDGSIQ